MSLFGSQDQKPSVLMRILKVIYWIIFAIALVIVLVFIAFKIFVAEPTKTGNEIIVNPDVVIQIPNNTQTGQDPSGSQSGDQPQSSLPPEDSDAPQELVLHRKDGVYTCLLAGTDDGNGCADTLMFGVFDTVNKTASLVSIPRDTLVNVKGKDYKINAVYAYHGIEGVCEAVSSMMAVPVDFYVKVELEAFSAIVDEIGGVWFTVPQDMDYEDPGQDLYIHLKQGYQLLDGKNALDLMRFRKGYSNQDLGRVQTQRNFLVAMVKQTISLSNVGKVTSLIKILNKYVDSNMPLNNMIFFATEAIGMDLNTALVSLTLPGDWIYPHMELRNEEVLSIVNALGIYEESVPLEALNIRHK